MLARIKGFAAGRFLWPTGDRGLQERYYLGKAPTLLLWGGSEASDSPVYSQAFRRALTEAASVKEQRIAAAGHVLLAEQPKESVEAIVKFSSE